MIRYKLNVNCWNYTNRVIEGPRSAHNLLISKHKYEMKKKPQLFLKIIYKIKRKYDRIDPVFGQSLFSVFINGSRYKNS